MNKVIEELGILDDRHILWSKEAVLDVLGFKSVTTLYQAIKNDNLPKPIRVGGRASRWRKSEVLEWLDSRPQGLEHEIQ